MPTFGVATFSEQGTTSIRVGATAVGTLQQIANGGTIWQGPAAAVARPQPLVFPAQGTEAQYDACYAALGDEDTLSWGIGGTSLTGRTATARLTEISEPIRLKQGNVVKWQMTFLVTG